MGKSQEDSKQMPLPKGGEPFQKGFLQAADGPLKKLSCILTLLNFSLFSEVSKLYALQNITATLKFCLIIPPLYHIWGTWGDLILSLVMISPETYGFGVRTETSGLHPTHIPGVENIEADSASRVFNDRTEWKLDQQVLSDIFSLFGKPDLDLFASRLNRQLTRYVSWIPDPNAVGVYDFTLD